MRPQIPGTVLASRLLAGLSEAARDAVLARARRRRLERGETVFFTGDPADTLYLVEVGWLKLTQTSPEGRDVVARFVGPGEILGAVAALGGGPYPGTAQAITPAHVHAWERAVLAELGTRFPRLTANILETVGAHLRESLEQVRELAGERVAQRLAHALLRLTDRPGGPTPCRAAPPLGRQELAEMIGATIFTVSRLLSQWENEGLVRAGRRHVEILDRARLRAVAAGAA